jgi:two-component system torCAD operon response regulator TorR
MPGNSTILVVDDEPISRHILVGYFESEGYLVREAQTAEQAEDILEEETIDLVLLDIRMPGKDGLTLTRELRVNSGIGIILVTTRQDDVDRIVGLECGADDYVTKPFNPREILARAKNLIFRVQQLREFKLASTSEGSHSSFNGWTLNANLRRLSHLDGEKVHLTDGECQLLVTLIGRAGAAMTRDDLMDKIRNREWVPNDRTIDVLIGRLRRKLRDNLAAPNIIVTVHGTGYLFNSKIIEHQS